MNIFADEQTKCYTREMVIISARRMKAEGVVCWWKDEILLVVFAGLMKNNLLQLPDDLVSQVQEIAKFCDVVCREHKTGYDNFILSPAGARISEYAETMKRVAHRLLV